MFGAIWGQLFEKLHLRHWAEVDRAGAGGEFPLGAGHGRGAKIPQKSKRPNVHFESLRKQASLAAGFGCQVTGVVPGLGSREAQVRCREE